MARSWWWCTPSSRGKAQPGCGSTGLGLGHADARADVAQVTGLDFAPEMLQDAERRQQAAPPRQAAARVRWVQAMPNRPQSLPITCP